MSDIGLEFVTSLKNKSIDYKNIIKNFFNKSKEKFNKIEVKYKPKNQSKVKKISVFPCKDCIVLPSGCSALCDKVEMNNKKVKELFLKHECCIDCGSTHLLEGPSGGMSQNIECAKCGHKFNLGLPLFIERI